MARHLVLIYAPTGALAEAEALAGELRAQGKAAHVRDIGGLVAADVEPCDAVRVVGVVDLPRVEALYPHVQVSAHRRPTEDGRRKRRATERDKDVQA